MSTETDAFETNRMTAREVDALFEDVGFGVLSMVHEGVPYGLPMSFGFDGGDELYFVFVGHEGEGRKVTYAAHTDRASFLAYDVRDDGGWRSAIATGPLDRVMADGWEAARDALADNAWHPRLLTDADPQRDPRVWALTIDERTGRKVRG